MPSFTVAMAATFICLSSTIASAQAADIKIPYRDKISCWHDAHRYCSHLKKEDGIVSLALCLQENKSRLHNSCVVTLAKYGY